MLLSKASNLGLQQKKLPYYLPKTCCGNSKEPPTWDCSLNPPHIKYFYELHSSLNFYLVHLQHSSCKHVFSIRVENSVDQISLFDSQTKKKRNDWLLADTRPQAANHCTLFESETVLKFYNHEARSDGFVRSQLIWIYSVFKRG